MTTLFPAGLRSRSVLLATVAAFVGLGLLSLSLLGSTKPHRTPPPTCKSIHIVQLASSARDQP
jgi:hypothetical protein